MAARTGTNRNPFSGLVDLVTDMNRISDRAHGIDSSGETEARSHVNAWTPSVDIAAVDDQLLIYAQLAGVAEQDIEVTYSAPHLTMAGHRRLPDSAAQQASYYAKELSWGRFRRTITLPEGICPQDVTVTFTHGLLCITVHRYSRAEGPTHLDINSPSFQR